MGVTSKIVVLGGGTGGTLAANRLRRLFGGEAEITVVDGDLDHVYRPGLLFVPFGLSRAEDLVRPRPRQLRSGISYHNSAVEHVDSEHDVVHLEDGSALGYDALVVATGARPNPAATVGLTGPGWMHDVFTFYDLPGATALEKALAGFDGGRLVVDVVDLPITWPVAPLEFCFLADWYFRERGVRGEVRLTYVTPLESVFATPVAAGMLGRLLEEKGVEVVTGFRTGLVEGGRLVSFDDRNVRFDLAVVVPPHAGAAYVGRSPGLGDEFDFVPADPHTLRSAARPNIFVIGDAAALPKAGSSTHFQGEVLARNVGRMLAGRKLSDSFDGHTTCFVETGFGRALLMDFNYDTEPLPGHFPAAVGLPLLKESRLTHLGKLMSAWLYWHGVLPGRDIPGVPSPMPRAGKRCSAARNAEAPE